MPACLARTHCPPAPEAAATCCAPLRPARTHAPLSVLPLLCACTAFTCSYMHDSVPLAWLPFHPLLLCRCHPRAGKPGYAKLDLVSTTDNGDALARCLTSFTINLAANCTVRPVQRRLQQAGGGPGHGGAAPQRPAAGTQRVAPPPAGPGGGATGYMRRSPACQRAPPPHPTPPPPAGVGDGAGGWQFVCGRRVEQLP